MPAEDDLEDLLDSAEAVKSKIEWALRERLDSDLPDMYVRLHSRIKTRRSIRNKIEDRRRNGKADYCLRDVTDIVGFRIVCHFQSDIQRVARLLLDISTEGTWLNGLHEPGRLYTTMSPNMAKLLKDLRALFQEYDYEFEEAAKDSRYTSLHLLCRSTRGSFPPIEFQIRNVFEDAWSAIEHAASYKAQSVSPTVRRHLTVLASLIQTCVEYAEAIRIDMVGDTHGSAGIKPITEYPGSWNKLKTPEKAFFQMLYDMRKEDKHSEIIDEIRKFRPAHLVGSNNDELRYVINMEEALSLLKLNRSDEAQGAYLKVAEEFPRRGMVFFRLAELYRSLGQYEKALLAFEKTEQLMVDGDLTRSERPWLERHLPLKKAYILWKFQDANAAYAAIAGPFQKLAQDDELQHSYFNSLVYYAVESTNKPPLEVLSLYMQRMRDEGMSSTETAAKPEQVETYAWLCWQAGEKAEAVRAMSEVMRCVKRVGGDKWFFEHKHKRWPIPQYDLGALLQHAGEIFATVSVQFEGNVPLGTTVQ